ncbi:L,D-transpeptidase [Falsochrobactrum sp. TDYN1]|uniref:L,D-transpeptidase n=1 Tax=Falsochrobactrum tianjinense TaxID=2706015 RepID=A0A949PK86_9HYPH|nr:L,D-transpeptidase [Falsochrobactrum sp. TDYN1]MBV2141918.1 L,D-transpeptidase [Falsochrobactrum sp. TDYN1]
MHLARKRQGHGIAIIEVRAKPGHKTRGLLVAGNLVLECALGKGGINTFKREGDGATPLAAMRLLYGYRRGDRGSLPPSRLPLRPVRRLDGWCDAPHDANYNRPVPLPFSASHEKMWRDDNLYDVCIVMDWNIATRKRGCGSAIFFHLAKPGYTPTEGCIALKRADMARLLPHLSSRTMIRVMR